MSSIRNILDIWFDEYQETIKEYNNKGPKVGSNAPLYNRLKKERDDFVEEAYVDELRYAVLWSVGQTGRKFTYNPYLVIKSKSEDDIQTPKSGRYVAFISSSNGESVYLALCFGSGEIVNFDNELSVKILNELRRFAPPTGFSNVGTPLLGVDNNHYAETCAIYKEYKRNNRPSEAELKSDIAAIMAVYEKYLSDEDGVKTEIEHLLGKTPSTRISGNKPTQKNGEGGADNKKSVQEYLAEWEKEGSSNKQIVFTGPPGTSKTYSVRKYLETGKSRVEFVQFHPSYDYTDFVEGLRPVEAEDGEPTFARVDGIFKSWCRKIVTSNLDADEESDKAGIEDKIESLFKAYEHQQVIKEQTPDGESATLSPEEEQIIKAWEDKCRDNKYYFIIDEINRADLSKVFGELMFGLEESYRGVTNRFDTQYQNLDTYVPKDGAGFAAIEKGCDCFRKGFFIPENLYIIGTMNDIDRSVETFDFALRRRFRWYRVDADAAMKPGLTDMANEATDPRTEADIDEMVDTMQMINEKIGAMHDLGLNPDFCIGPAYLRKWVRKEEEKGEAWKNRIKPLLFEYCRGYSQEKVKSFVEELEELFLGRNSTEGQDNQTKGQGDA